jgi:ribosome-associated translation inhibitor RaiA
MTLMQHKHWRGCHHEARMGLQLAGKTLQATYIAKTPYDAVYAALKLIEHQLREV